MRTPDLPIPAPIRWADLRPTDAPVAQPCWFACRSIEGGYWLLHLYDTSRPTDVRPVSRLRMVVDDHGELALLGEAPEASNLHWINSEDFEPAAREHIEAEWERERAAYHARRRAEATRALLRPPPVRATLTEAPELYPCHAAAIDISTDVRTDAPSYRVTCDHQVLTLSHAQLAALMLAGQALCAVAHHRGRLQ